ncbi:MAG TPA: hypothetical protein VHK90_07790 [Thermoanaerobaculia bacterium]|nr:hypothetical protein [Thermoanaerobaculia bacterium]
MADLNEATGSTTDSGASGANRGSRSTGYTSVPVTATYDPANDSWLWNPPAPNVVELKVPPGGNPNFVVTITIDAVGQTVSQAQIDWTGARPPALPSAITVPSPEAPNQLRFGVVNDKTGGEPQSYGFEVSGTLANGTPFRSPDPEVVLDPP